MSTAETRVTVYFDSQDPDNQGWAYAIEISTNGDVTENESGPLDAEDAEDAKYEAEAMFGFACIDWQPETPDGLNRGFLVSEG